MIIMGKTKQPISDYWKKREEEELKWQEKNIANDEDFNRLIARYYQSAIVQINKDIDHYYQNLANSVGGLDNAYGTVKTADIADYEAEAQKMVLQAAQMREAGQKVTYDSFPDDVNRRMKVYNATMRINRLEYLKSQVGLRLTEANMNIANELNLKLNNDYIDETKRQAGILGKTLKYNVALLSDNISKIIMSSTKGGNWSERLWVNNDALKARLDGVLAAGLITGQSNQAMARKLKDQVRTAVTNSRYVTERLARTESARVQFKAQMDSITAADYKYVKWYAEPGACRICQEINDNDRYDLGYGVFPVDEVPSIPIHPNCRCSVSAYWVDGENNLGHHAKAKAKAAEDDFDKLMKADINKLHEKDIIKIGGKAYGNLAKQGIATGKQLATLEKNFGEINKKYNENGFATYKDYYDTWQNNAKAIIALRNEQADRVAKELSKYRSVGNKVAIKFQPRSSVPLRNMIKEVYKHYPSDWSAEAEEMNTLKVKQAARGYYINSRAEISADKNSYDAQSTMYHELGHRQEKTNQNILRLEGEFFNRRTKDDKEQPLSKLTGNKAYDRTNETAKPDNFKNPYMGKSYTGRQTGRPLAYELLSMGAEGIYQGKYDLYSDEDMAKFILGLLLKG